MKSKSTTGTLATINTAHSLSEAQRLDALSSAGDLIVAAAEAQEIGPAEADALLTHSFLSAAATSQYATAAFLGGSGSFEELLSTATLIEDKLLEISNARSDIKKLEAIRLRYTALDQLVNIHKDSLAETLRAIVAKIEQALRDLRTQIDERTKEAVVNYSKLKEAQVLLENAAKMALVTGILDMFGGLLNLAGPKGQIAAGAMGIVVDQLRPSSPSIPSTAFIGPIGAIDLDPARYAKLQEKRVHRKIKAAQSIRLINRKAAYVRAGHPVGGGLGDNVDDVLRNIGESLNNQHPGERSAAEFHEDVVNLAQVAAEFDEIKDVHDDVKKMKRAGMWNNAAVGVVAVRQQIQAGFNLAKNQEAYRYEIKKIEQSQKDTKEFIGKLDAKQQNLISSMVSVVNQLNQIISNVTGDSNSFDGGLIEIEINYYFDPSTSGIYLEPMKST
ncbi:hypothetical protein HDU99_005300 [Rhizoclosmatium hyalinum]|nr:hypothetical protein HDU99_005300 [Rhizoclosmatium hyalinum]